MSHYSSRQELLLTVKRSRTECLFELTDFSQESPKIRISTKINISNDLIESYEAFREQYEELYDHFDNEENKSFRVHNLRRCHNDLTRYFTEWLAHENLSKIREYIRDLALRCPLDLLIACEDKEEEPFLSHLPWEAWELVSPTKEPKRHQFRIARSVINLEEQDAQEKPPQTRPNVRILAIFGDDRGTDFSPAKEVLGKFPNHINVKFVEPQPDQTVAQLKAAIKNEVSASIGWDLIVLIGHRDCSDHQIGLGIAPGILMHIDEIKPDFVNAINHGLQAAIFISFKSLEIGELLVSLGLPQAVVIREKIYGKVAVKLLIELCKHLRQYQDIHNSLISACHDYFHLETESPLYPAVDRIPSFLRRSNVQPFCLEPSRLKRWLTAWRPTRSQAITLGTVAFLSLVTPLRAELLDGRYWTQAVYRNATEQITRQRPSPPPVTIVAIDQATIEQENISNNKVNPIDRGYIAKLIDKTKQLNAAVVGINYLLPGASSYPKDDASLKQAIEQAVQAPNPLWLTFGSREDDTGQFLKLTESVAGQQVLRSDMGFRGWSIPLPQDPWCQLESGCGFAYQLALAHQLRQNQTLSPTSAFTDLRLSMTQELQALPATDPARTLVQPLSWPFAPDSLPFPLQPTIAIDFSIPPNQVYRWIPARTFRTQSKTELQDLGQQVVIIAAGGYDLSDDRDKSEAPAAILYWRQQSRTGEQPRDSQPSNSILFPSGAVQAYMVHHFLSQHLLLRIPDIWCVLVSALAAKGILLVVRQRSTRPKRELGRLAVVPFVYGVGSVVVYQSALVLLPWFFPAIVFWLYLLLDWRTFAQE